VAKIRPNLVTLLLSEVVSRVVELSEGVGVLLAGLPDFSWYNTTKTVKIYQMAIEYTKRQ
jgi:hypothetical protein